MIELSRALVRQFRAVARKSVLAADPRGPCPIVVCSAGRRGLTLSCRQGKAGVRHHTPGSFPTAGVTVPFSKLVDLEGAGGVVALEQTAPFTARASWQSDEGPRVLEFDTADPSSLPAAPEPARESARMDQKFLAALDDAARTASRDAVRFAVRAASNSGAGTAPSSPRTAGNSCSKAGSASPGRGTSTCRPCPSSGGVSCPAISRSRWA